LRAQDPIGSPKRLGPAKRSSHFATSRNGNELSARVVRSKEGTDRLTRQSGGSGINCRAMEYDHDVIAPLQCCDRWPVAVIVSSIRAASVLQASANHDQIVLVGPSKALCALCLVTQSDGGHAAGRLDDMGIRRAVGLSGRTRLWFSPALAAWVVARRSQSQSTSGSPIRLLTAAAIRGRGSGSRNHMAEDERGGCRNPCFRSRHRSAEGSRREFGNVDRNRIRPMRKCEARTGKNIEGQCDQSYRSAPDQVWRHQSRSKMASSGVHQGMPCLGFWTDIRSRPAIAREELVGSDANISG
jgi:hypothetical protein